MKGQGIVLDPAEIPWSPEHAQVGPFEVFNQFGETADYQSQKVGNCRG